MPLLSQFFGITVRVHWGDHPPPHVHIAYGGSRASMDITTLEIIRGQLPRRARILVVEWALAHRPELEAAWEAASRLDSPGTIEPLR